MARRTPAQLGPMRCQGCRRLVWWDHGALVEVARNGWTYHRCIPLRSRADRRIVAAEVTTSGDR